MIQRVRDVMDDTRRKRPTIAELREQARTCGRPYPEDFINLLASDERQGAQALCKQLKARQLALDREKARIEATKRVERGLNAKGYRLVAGVDEAGRGPLAGPIVAAAVILSPETWISGLDDSKVLSEKKRLSLFPQIYEQAIDVGVGVVDAAEIDKDGIQAANFRVMRLALSDLDTRPDGAIIDGFDVPGLDVYQKSIIDADRKCLCVAAASVVAKVTRDEMMRNWHTLHPQYGFAKHKGYGTREHIKAIARFGLCEIHRRSFLRSHKRRSSRPVARSPV